MTVETRAAKRRRGRARGAVFAAAAVIAAALIGQTPGLNLGLTLGPTRAWAQTPEKPTLRLFQAVRTGDMAGLKQSLTDGANTGARNTEGRTAAQLAGDLGRFGMAQWLRMQPAPEGAAADEVIQELPAAVRAASASAASADASGAAFSPDAVAGVAVDMGPEADPFGAASLGIAPLDTPTPLNAAALPPEPAAAPAIAEPGAPAAAPRASAQTAGLRAARAEPEAAPEQAALQDAAKDQSEDQSGRNFLDRVKDFFSGDEPAQPEPAPSGAGQTRQASADASAPAQPESALTESAASESAAPAPETSPEAKGFFDDLRRNLGFGRNDEEKAPGEKIGGRDWKIENVRAVRAAPEPAQQPPSEPVSSEILALESLRIGAAPNLGRALPQLSGEAMQKSCVTKRSGAVTVCVEPMDWPADIAAVIRANSDLLQGLSANVFVRYDNGVATRYHAMFAAESYDAMKAHYTAKYGLPNEAHRWKVGLLSGADENRAALWSNISPEGQGRSWLEIRKFDDTRGGFPDADNGVLALYSDGGGPLFPLVSVFDLNWLRPMQMSGLPAQVPAAQ